MKQIVFTKEDFNHIFCLKRMFEYIFDKLQTIDCQTISFQLFQKEFEEQLNVFSAKFRLLNESAKNYHHTISTYFEINSEPSNLGIECFELIDNLGDFFDLYIQNHNLQSHFLSLHEDMFLDEIYY